MRYLKATLYTIYMALSAIYFSLLGAALKPFTSFPTRFRYVSGWARTNIWMLEKLLGLRFEVHGYENIPNKNAIILSKHQSTWETIAFQCIFPPQTWVLKKELLKIPFFGWGLASLDPVAINRKDRRKAMEQIIEQGRNRLENGYWLVIFPEGTRIPAGKKGKYRLGGARLAKATGYQVVPVAHNAGEFWSKGQYLISSGVIKIYIGSPIDTKDLSTEEINKRVEEFIEQKMEEITDPKLLPITLYDKTIYDQGN